MTTIKLITKINASIETVFDLNRDTDVYQLSTNQSNEKVIAGVTSGLISKNERVTWRGKHFGFYLTHKSIISKIEIPNYFIDEMMEGNFKSFKHKHTFSEENGIVTMIDKLLYEAPFGIFRKLFDQLILKRYLTNFFLIRNQFLKELAENQQQNPPQYRNTFYPKSRIVFRFFFMCKK